MKKEIVMFFDTNCFSEMPLEDLRYCIQYPGKKVITSSVLSEIMKGYAKSPQKKGFSFILESDGKLKRKFSVINLEQCNKKEDLIDLNKNIINIKQNPNLCSSYYMWLTCAINPCLVTDPFRHEFNNALVNLKKYGDNDNKISKLQGNLRLKEVEGLNIMRRILGKSESNLEKRILTSSRKKRFKEVKNNKLKLADYQTMVIALLYACYAKKKVAVISCDMDLSDIKENVIRSIIEKYSINQLLADNSLHYEINNQRINFFM